MSNQNTFGPYSPVKLAGNFYYISGQVGVNPVDKTASADIASQTRQTLDNMKKVLSSVGLSINDVVKTTIFLTNIDDFAAVNEVYLTYFDPPRPARSCVGVKELPKVGGDVTIKIEIEAVAYKEHDNE